MPFTARSRPPSFTRLAVPASALVLALLLPAPAANASQDPRGCPAQVLEQPFIAWGDSAPYRLAPGGSFELGVPGWTLAGGAELVAPGAPFIPASAATALSLAPGASATSAPICVGPSDLFARMFASADDASGDDGTRLRVDLILANGFTLPLPPLHADEEWNATRRIYTGAGAERVTWMRYRFTARVGTWALDDLYVDPRANH
jgi:hypothetical protein